MGLTFDRAATKRSTEQPAQYLPNSPFQNGQSELLREMIPSTLEYTEGEPGMGTVESISNEVGKDGQPVRINHHRVRVECLHWAPNHNVNDCRFGCGAKGK